MFPKSGLTCLTSLALMWLACPARAESSLTVPPTAAEPALTVRIVTEGADTKVLFQSCTAMPCALSAEAKSQPLPRRFDPAKSELSSHTTPSGARVVWLRAPAKEGAGFFEVLMAPGRTEPIFAAATALAAAEVPTERLLRREVKGGSLFLRSSTPAHGGLCGVPTAPGPVQAWDGARWSGATVARIDAATASRALTVSPKPLEGELPSWRLLTPLDGSDSSKGRALVDGDPRTAWTEQRSGDGLGEFATFALDPHVEIHALGLQLAPSAEVPGFAAPRSFFVLLEGTVLKVVLPSKPVSGPLQIELPKPQRSRCVSVVLDQADTKVKAPRAVGLAELVVRHGHEALDQDALFARLEQPEQVDEALALLLALPKVESARLQRAFGALSLGRRAALLDALQERECAEAVPVFALGLASHDELERRRAERKIEQCRRAAAPSLIALLELGTATAPESIELARAAARHLAMIAPSLARVELPPRLGVEATRSAFWPALARALRGANQQELEASLALASAQGKLDAVLALGSRAPELTEAKQVIEAASREPSVVTRYRAIAPALVLGDGASVERLAQAPEPLVRHQLFQALTEGARRIELEPLIERALADENPRVRAEAAEYFGRHAEAASASAARERALFARAEDPWPWVRTAVLHAIAGWPGAHKVVAKQTLLARMVDDNMDVRIAALGALRGVPAAQVHDAILRRLDDEREAIPVRAEAARALGLVCDYSQLERLTVLTHAAISPDLFELERAVGAAALEALSMLRPPDLPKRLAPLLAKDTPPVLQKAAARALAAPAQCQR